MAAYMNTFAANTTRCGSTAEAASHACVRIIMDTAVILAVSIFVRLISLVLVLNPGA
jgi:hypothetical protein